MCPGLYWELEGQGAPGLPALVAQLAANFLVGELAPSAL